MKYSELDSIKHLKEQAKILKILIKTNNGLRFIGLGIKKISKLKQKINELETQLTEFNEITQKFISTFSVHGWIPYDNLDLDLMKDALKKYETDGIEKSEELILEYYKPENIEFELISLKAVPEILRRYKFIDFAYNDYKEEKYYMKLRKGYTFFS